MKIQFMPAGKEIFTNKNENLLNIANQAGVLIDASCGGTKKCGKCKVKILNGVTAPLTEVEMSLLSPFEIENGYRLACCLDIDSDLEVYVPASHGGSTRKKRMTILPEGFVADTFECSSPCYGIAFDIGTTTVVGMLWYLANHTLVDTEARTNYQSIYGADVISRIQFCNQDDSNVTLLQQKVISCFNDILEDLLIRNQILPQQIHDVTIVGNTTMSHLVTGVHPRPLALAPFTPVFLEAPNLSAEELGLHVNPSANVYLLPNIAGHVGSDIVGMMLSTSIYKSSGSHIAIDIGTNGEIVAIKNGRLLTCSTAAGPAFEGACIHHGMRAASGAIEKVVITGGEVQIQTIDNSVPVGLCGSGLIDAVAALLDAGVIEPSGRMLPQDEALEEELVKAQSELDDIPEINLEGQNVKHRMFGKGLVAKQTGSYIEVAFAAKTSKFILTTAFIGGFLSSEDASVLERCKQLETAIALYDKKEKAIKSKQAELDLLIAKLK
jgi:uncharacterized 2Fe-2S/4Fe-4S cluster protein (DUF4445 family)